MSSFSRRTRRRRLCVRTSHPHRSAAGSSPPARSGKVSPHAQKPSLLLLGEGPAAGAKTRAAEPARGLGGCSEAPPRPCRFPGHAGGCSRIGNRRGSSRNAEQGAAGPDPGRGGRRGGGEAA